jgi:cold shock protein
MKEERGFGRPFLARVVPIGHRRRWPTVSPCGPFLWKLGAFWRPFSFRARYDRGATQSCLEQIMSKGTVKWFNPTKGYGFIQPQGGGGRDVFVHISAVERAGLSSLNEGQVVEYEEVSNRGKTSAENLKVQR